MTERERPRVLLLGAGEEAGRWAAALGGYADVVRNHDADWRELEGLVIARGALDPFSRAKEALLAGRPVLYAVPFLLSPWQAGILAELSRTRGAMLHFVEPLREQPALAFLRRLFEGKEPLWQPLYMRTVRLEEPGAARIDELAVEELAICDSLLGRAPEWVEATAARGSESVDVLAVFMTAQYANGPVVRCTVSLGEGRSERSLVVATCDRTIVVDDLAAAASLRLVRPGTAGAGELLAFEAPAKDDDPIAAEARAFARIAVGACVPSNADRWARIAGMWWAARQSMSFGGPVELPAAVRVQTAPPPLQLIKGGGKTSRSGRRPALTLVAS